MCGNGNNAYEYFRKYMPAAYNTRAEIRQIEPYVYCQSTHSKSSPRYGNSRVPWLSGSATWSFVAATQFILGLQPQHDGLLIDPCIPSSWDGFEVSRRFRGKELHIRVKNPYRIEKGVSLIKINGVDISGNKVLFQSMKEINEVEVIMG